MMRLSDGPIHRAIRCENASLRLVAHVIHDDDPAQPGTLSLRSYPLDEQRHRALADRDTPLYTNVA